MGRDATTPPTAVGGVALGRAGGKTYLIPVLRASALNPTQAKTAWAGAPLSLALVITELHLNFIVRWSLTWGPPHTVRNVVKEPFYIGIEHISVPLPVEFQDQAHGRMTVLQRSEALRSIVKERFENRLEKATNHLLADAIPDRRYA